MDRRGQRPAQVNSPAADQGGWTNGAATDPARKFPSGITRHRDLFMAHILIIDDDRAIRDFLRRVMEMKGHLVSTAANGREALATFNDTVELVICDMLMPEMNGAQTIHALKDRSPGLPVIGISGGGTEPARNLLGVATVVGADRTLAKPFTVLALGEAVAAVMKKPEGKSASGPVLPQATSIGTGWQRIVGGR